MDRVSELSRIAYFAYIKEGNNLWVSNKRYNGLYRINIKTRETFFEGRFKQYSYDKVMLHSYAVKYKNDICFLPQTGETIDVFNIETGNIQSYTIPQWSRKKSKIVAGYVQINEDVYLIPKILKDPILVFSIKKRTITKFMDLNINELDFLRNYKYELLINNVVSDGKKLWYTIFDTNLIIEVDIESISYRVYKLSENIKLHSIKYDGSDFWISSGLSIIRWQPECGIKEKYDGLLTDEKRELNFYSEILFNGEYVYAIPQWGDKIVWINKNTKKIGVYNIKIEGFHLINDSTQNWRHFRNAYICNDELIINPVAYNMEIHINIFTNKIYGREYLADKKSVYVKRILFNEEIYTLSGYINMHVMSNEEKESVKFNNVGEKIYNFIDS